jgi:hypothetical protein
MSSLHGFAKRPPYASALYGVYQPMLGWRARTSASRLLPSARERADETLAALAALAAPTVPQPPSLPSGPDPTESPLPRGPGRPGPQPRPVDPRVARQVGDRIRAEVAAFVKKQGRPPNSTEWLLIMGQVFAPAPLGSARAGAGGAPGEPGVEGHYTAAVVATATATAPSVDGAAESGLRRVAGWLARVSPTLLTDLTLAPALELETALLSLDPLTAFDPETTDAVLSPIGLLHVFRQYFFELDSFLGPAIDHVWVAPGGSVEVVEVRTRRVVHDRASESSVESNRRTEGTVTEEQELADTIKEENERNIKLGTSASGGVNFGVAHGEISADFSLESTRRRSRETAHKLLRTQSEHSVNELRKAFRMSVRTTTETFESSSRRHLIRNQSSDVVNYEMRQKVRRVGVQLQEVGTRLCWQIFIEDPGRSLGVAELVHVAQPADLVNQAQPLEAPASLPDQQHEEDIQIPFVSEGKFHDIRGACYVNGFEEGNSNGAKIRTKFEQPATPPGPGYRLSHVALVSVEKVDVDGDPPTAALRFDPLKDEPGYNVILDQVCFNDQPALRLIVRLYWSAPAPPAEVGADDSKMKVESQRRAQEEIARAVRERVRLAGQVQRRPGADLREEERTAIYRQIIRRLTAQSYDGPGHLTSEIVRALFDVDGVLYFVAPDWWRPRNTALRQQLGGSVERSHKIGWGGVDASGRPNYAVTEDSAPAPMGASLGWLIQLDGDERRNAFLNAPWVKAVIPIRPGREESALKWLQHQGVEGSDGLDAAIAPSSETTVREALATLAESIAAESRDMAKQLATEIVFEQGFSPLEGGFQYEPEQNAVFDQWLEVVPTDQVVAVRYEPNP